MIFNSTNVQSAATQKHFSLFLDSKLGFNDHVDNKINRCNKIIGLVKNLSSILLRKSSLTYKSFVRPNLDYADNICQTTK